MLSLGEVFSGVVPNQMEIVEEFQRDLGGSGVQLVW